MSCIENIKDATISRILKRQTMKINYKSRQRTILSNSCICQPWQNSQKLRTSWKTGKIACENSTSLPKSVFEIFKILKMFHLRILTKWQEADKRVMFWKSSSHAQKPATLRQMSKFDQIVKLSTFWHLCQTFVNNWQRCQKNPTFNKSFSNL